MDWFDPSPSPRLNPTTTTADTTTKPTPTAAEAQVIALNKVLKPGGRVFFRSAARRPWYTDLFEKNAFEVKCVALREGGKCIDRYVSLTTLREGFGDPLSKRMLMTSKE